MTFNKEYKTGLFLFILGFLGILSTLISDIPVSEEIEEMILELLSPFQLKLISLINPTILLLIALFMGMACYKKVNLKLPIIENIIDKQKKITDVYSIIKYGITGGIISGVLIVIISIIFKPLLPIEYLEIGTKFKLNIFTRFFYGGFTEEILIRFGFMTFLVWLTFKISGKLNPFVYWIGIIISSIAFGIGHLPMIYSLVGTPTNELLFYIIIANAIGGIIFGWLYWKKGLEAAIIGHIFAHVIMAFTDLVLNLNV